MPQLNDRIGVQDGGRFIRKWVNSVNFITILHKIRANFQRS
jgi:hypothetical protein